VRLTLIPTCARVLGVRFAAGRWRQIDLLGSEQRDLTAAEPKRGWLADAGGDRLP
jgi:hypothetical protein